MATAESLNIEKHLKNMHFPAKREEIVAHARQQGADEQVCNALRQLPAQQQFNSVSEVSKTLNSGSSDQNKSQAGGKRDF
ncbi:DUF2795 domain-containing protein [Dictyobacter kobayashii]|uniref:DUF2795 domain-containing protein n=1 Tax=Dictyobacter kobayashii TaxID=2014872 RepID=A0A402AUC7_9CHLR|nr:DUF2795 domain-containing protein [Dictyobacter kobayashii]GCE22687.1 hypothetical protein KDK_64870 [Dictyobacter kobayashii]